MRLRINKKVLLYMVFWFICLLPNDVIRLFPSYETYFQYLLQAALGTILFVAEDCQSYVKHFTTMGAIFDFVANFWFIPHFGITGAAITTALSHILVGFIAPLFVKKTRRFIVLYFKSFLLFPELLLLIFSTLKRR